MSWIALRREVLREQIQHNQNTLTRLQQTDTSNLDDFNQENYEYVIQRLHERIAQDEEELAMLL